MPDNPNNPNVPGSSTSTQGWLANAPGSDLSFDDLFPAEGPYGEPVTQVLPSEPAQTPAQVPQAPREPEYFLKTPTGTVYRTREEAEKGFAHKDEVINQLRQKYIQEKGIDPVTGKIVRSANSQDSQQPVNYVRDRKRFYRDASEAVQKGDEEAYADVQMKLIADVLEPVAPLISTFAKSQAVESVSSEVKNFREFMHGPDYEEVLKAEPELAEAIQISEGDLRFSQRLPGLYRLAYRAAQGLKLPEILRAQTPTSQSPTNVRPTMSSTTLAPESQPAGPEPDLSTSEGRKAIIEREIARGVLDIKW